MAGRKEQQSTQQANDKVAMEVLTEPSSMRGFSFKQELILTTLQTVGVLGAGILTFAGTLIGGKIAAQTAASNMAAMQMYAQTQTSIKGGKN